jgi:4-hydroxy-3-methylbut-2-enyl diphosphate reductase
MEVIVAQTYGFCFGVKRAVQLAKGLRIQYDAVYVDGELIHNEQVLGQLKENNIHTCNDEDLLKAAERCKNGENGCLLIRAHGISLKRRTYLQNLGLPLKDATCPDVGCIAGKIKIYDRKGYTIVIYGKKDHPEARGLLGHAACGEVIESVEDVAHLPFPSHEWICLLSQSTMWTDAFEGVCRAMKAKYPQVVVLNTICKSTLDRQSAVKKLADCRVDGIVVVGDQQSSNARQLASLGATLCPTILVENVKALETNWECKKWRKAGLTAGTSTPQFVIDPVHEYLRSL